MKNKITDLNNHLFAQIERLSDEDLTTDGIEKEVKRSYAIVKIADKIIGGASMQLSAAKLVAEYGGRHLPDLPMLGVTNEGN